MPQDAQNISFPNIFIPKPELYKTINNYHPFQSFDTVFQHQFYDAQKHFSPFFLNYYLYIKL